MREYYKNLLGGRIFLAMGVVVFGVAFAVHAYDSTNTYNNTLMQFTGEENGMTLDGISTISFEGVAGGYIYGMAAIPATNDMSTYSNVAVSFGQLLGSATETNENFYVPIKARSLEIVGNSLATNLILSGDAQISGVLHADGSGLSNLNASELSGKLPDTALPANGVWDVSGMTITNLMINGQDLAATLDSYQQQLDSQNLTAGGIVNGNLEKTCVQIFCPGHSELLQD